MNLFRRPIVSSACGQYPSLHVFAISHGSCGSVRFRFHTTNTIFAHRLRDSCSLRRAYSQQQMLFHILGNIIIAFPGYTIFSLLNIFTPLWNKFLQKTQSLKTLKTHHTWHDAHLLDPGTPFLIVDNIILTALFQNAFSTISYWHQLIISKTKKKPTLVFILRNGNIWDTSAPKSVSRIWPRMKPESTCVSDVVRFYSRCFFFCANWFLPSPAESPAKK